MHQDCPNACQAIEYSLFFMSFESLFLKPCTKSKAMSDYIPQALVLDIISRLPPKTLVRCTLVCKAWNTIIKSHTFVSSHLQQSLSNPSLSLLLICHVPIHEGNEQFSLWSTGAYGLRKIAKLHYSLPIPQECDLHLRIVNAICGVICLISDLLIRTNFIILWNPFIQRHIQLPTPLFTARTLRHSCMFFHGFGFDSKKNDFKVVRVGYRTGVRGVVPPLAELYSVNEGAWRIIDASFVDVRIVEHVRTQCSLHGNVHWLACEGTHAAFQHCALRFNVVEENFTKIRLPPELSSLPCFELSISVLNGCLSILDYVYQQTTSVNIWMQGESESWNKMSSINLQCGVRKVLAAGTSDEIFVVQRGQSLGGFLHLFEPKREKMTNLGIQDTGPGFFVSEFTQSLALFDTENDAFCTMNRSCVEWVQDEEPEESI